jgi:hypothetical protein
MALDAVINRWSRFDRKNYFYADLPQGYQISQLYHPLVGPGEVEILLDEKDENSVKQIGIERIHVEQDAGKLMHDQHPTMSYVDLNRSGVALMEIVSPLTCVRLPKQGLICGIESNSPLCRRATAIWRKARCAPTSMSACGKWAVSSAPAPRPRTSIRSASSWR